MLPGLMSLCITLLACTCKSSTVTNRIADLEGDVLNLILAQPLPWFPELEAVLIRVKLHQLLLWGVL
jgi:hypothetical protein